MKRVYYKSEIKMGQLEIYEGETIETKVKRVTENKEPITDGAPIIFTEKKDGVIPAYNIRTDKWDVALEAMDKVQSERIAKSIQSIKKEKEEQEKAINEKELENNSGNSAKNN